MGELTPRLCKHSKPAIAQDYSSGEPMCQDCIKEFIEKRLAKVHRDRPGICKACPTFEEGCEGSNQEDCERSSNLCYLGK